MVISGKDHGNTWPYALHGLNPWLIQASIFVWLQMRITCNCSLGLCMLICRTCPKQFNKGLKCLPHTLCMLLLQASLDRLQIPKLALYQIHFPAAFLNSFANTAFVRGLAHCQQIGLTDAVGVSNFNEKRLREAHRTLQVCNTKPAGMRLLIRSHVDESHVCRHSLQHESS